LIAGALSLPCLFASLAEHGEQNRRQDRDYRDHDEQLNQCEAKALLHRHHADAPLSKI
jgi:hypothetical protein